MLEEEKLANKNWNRASKYDPDSTPARAYAILAVGDGLPAVAKELEISRTTLSDWRSRYPDFDEAIERGISASEAWWDRTAREYLVTYSSKDDGSTRFDTRLFIFIKACRYGAREKDPITINIDGQDLAEVKKRVTALHNNTI